MQQLKLLDCRLCMLRLRERLEVEDQEARTKGTVTGCLGAEQLRPARAHHAEAVGHQAVVHEAMDRVTPPDGFVEAVEDDDCAGRAGFMRVDPSASTGEQERHGEQARSRLGAG